jgi:deoxyribodipyrimidine photolyase-related protein
MPNTLGMALFGDGGIVGSKPYAASGKYIKKMSNFCEQCRYDPDETVGELACPFNALYWDFMARHRAQFETNPRVSLVFGTWERMGETRQDGIRQQAALTLERMQRGEL